jgi:predicted transcriptional regulator
MKRVRVETSIEAYRKLDPIRVSQTMQKISDALKTIQKGNYEMIAVAAGLKQSQTWKRLIDCVRAGLIHRIDETMLTKDGCKSYLYAPGPATQIAAKKERVMKGKTISQYSKDILSFQQEKLF